MLIIPFKTNAQNLEQFIHSAGDAQTVLLPEGEIFIDRKVIVRGKKNLTIKGNNTKIVSTFDPKTGFDTYKGVFDFSECSGLKLQNITFDTDKAVNAAGEIVAVDIQKNTFDVKMYEGCVLDGNQTVLAINSMDRRRRAFQNIFLNSRAVLLGCFFNRYNLCACVALERLLPGNNVSIG